MLLQTAYPRASRVAAAPACGGGRRYAPTPLRCSTRPAVGEGQHTALADRLPRPRLRCSAPPKAGAAATRLACEPESRVSRRTVRRSHSLLSASTLAARQAESRRRGFVRRRAAQPRAGRAQRASSSDLRRPVRAARAQRAERVTPHGPRGAAQRSQRAALTAAPAASARFRLPCGCSRDAREVDAQRLPGLTCRATSARLRRRSRRPLRPATRRCRPPPPC